MTASEKTLKMKQFKCFCPTHACTIPTQSLHGHLNDHAAVFRDADMQRELGRFGPSLGRQALLEILDESPVPGMLL